MGRSQRLKKSLVVHNLKSQPVTGDGDDRVDRPHDRPPVRFPVQSTKEDRQNTGVREVTDVRQHLNRIWKQTEFGVAGAQDLGQCGGRGLHRVDAVE